MVEDNSNDSNDSTRLLPLIKSIENVRSLARMYLLFCGIMVKSVR